MACRHHMQSPDAFINLVAFFCRLCSFFEAKKLHFSMMHSIVNGRKNRRNVERHRARRLAAASHTEWRANAGIVSHGVRFCVSAADSAAVSRSRVRRSALSWPYEPRAVRCGITVQSSTLGTQLAVRTTRRPVW